MPKTLEELEREFADRGKKTPVPVPARPSTPKPVPEREPEPTPEQEPEPAPERKTPGTLPIAGPAEAPAPEKTHRVRELVFDLLVYGFALILIAGSTMFAFSNNTDKHILGYRFYQVLTPSMEPVFGVGDMIFVRLCAPEDVQAGDIITFSPNRNAKAYLTHRAIEVRPGENGEAPVIVTKGDANNLEDPPISGTAVVGKYVFHIPYAGGILQFIRDNLILMGICLAAAFALLIFLRAYFDARRESEETGGD
jgi:signal peptidase